MSFRILPAALRLVLIAPLLLLPSSCASTHAEEDGERTLSAEEVRDRADGLHEGMSQRGVRVLLGKPHRTDPSGNVWVYMPDRKARLVPGSALRLRFQNGSLAEYGWRPVVLGQPMDF